MPNTEHKPSQDIALGVVYDGQRILVGERPPESHQGSYLEFPGGKLHPGESQYDGLVREVYEETGIRVLNMQPLIEFEWDYPQYHLSFSVFKVDSWTPQAPLKEGWQWMPLEDAKAKHFPPANRCIINALRLPDCYLITPPYHNDGGFIEHCAELMNRNIELCVFRDYALDNQRYAEVLNRLLACSDVLSSEVLVHNRISVLEQVPAAGIHLSADQLMRCTQRPVSEELWFAASCHNQEELKRAVEVGVDFAVLGPVCKTASHPNARAMGWQAFAELIKKIPLPVYAVGGLSSQELSQSYRHGAQGVAGITSLWGAS